MKLPNPPAALQPLRLGDVVHLRRGTSLWRIYAAGGPHPQRWDEFRAFGPTNSRFDHHEPPPRAQGVAILYAASGPHAIRTCVAEYFQETRTIDPRRQDPRLVGFRLTASLALLDLGGTWPTRAGASMNINSGPRSQARKWSRAVHACYPNVEGLHYCSSMNANEAALALYERARHAMPATPIFHRPLTDLAPLLRAACRVLGYTLV